MLYKVSFITVLAAVTIANAREVIRKQYSLQSTYTIDSKGSLNGERGMLSAQQKGEVHDQDAAAQEKKAASTISSKSASEGPRSILKIFPGQITSIQQGIAWIVWTYRYLSLFTVCCCMSLFAICISIRAITGHLQMGRRLTGSIYTPHPSSVEFVRLLWAVPVFAVMGILGLLYPELAGVFQFLQMLALAGSLALMPNLFLHAVGGSLELQRCLQSQSESQLLPLFTFWPFVKSKVPDMDDVNDLRRAVAILCMVLPFLSLFEMCCSVEATLGGSGVTSGTDKVDGMDLSLRKLVPLAPRAALYIRILEALLISVAMVLLQSFERLLRNLSPLAQKMSTQHKMLYCMTFLAGLRLAPILVHLATMLSGTEDTIIANIARNFIICANSLACAILSLQAYPADERHYPQFIPAGTSASSNTEGLTPVLDKMKFCPFCGSENLKLESNAETDCASCPRCGAHQVPLHLVVQRGTAERAESMATTAKAGTERGGGCLQQDHIMVED
jgi:hypothetical protein